MKVSVIIPTFNAASYLPDLLGRLHNQTMPPHEIIVVDSSSSDRSAEIARRSGAKVYVINRDHFDHGGTRNFAARESTGDVLVFLTQDALPKDRTFLELLVRPLREADVAAVCGRQIARSEANIIERMTREFNYPERAIRKTIQDLPEMGIKLFFFTNVCSAFRRDVFQKIGGFPEPIILNEDMIIAAKCILSGYTVVYNPDASVIHSHNYGLRKQFRRNFDIGVSLSMHNWLLQYSTAEKEGRKLVQSQIGQLWREGHRWWIPRLLAESAAKYAGYRLGLSYKSIPYGIRRKCSMHSNFWLKGKQTFKGVEYERRSPSA